MSFCINCGTQLPDAARFCPSCGTAVSQPKEASAAACASAAVQPEETSAATCASAVVQPKETSAATCAQEKPAEAKPLEPTPDGTAPAAEAKSLESTSDGTAPAAEVKPVEPTSDGTAPAAEAKPLESASVAAASVSPAVATAGPTGYVPCNSTAGAQADSRGAEGRSADAGATSHQSQNYVRAEVVSDGTEGYITRAWHDLSSSKSWIGKVALLSLIDMVPILDFVSIGYSVQWGRDAALGKKSPLSENVFENRTFYWGFLTLVIAFIAGIVGGLFGVVPVLGVLIALACATLAEMCVMRMVVGGEFGKAFDFKNIWELFKNNPGATLVIVWVPYLICFAIVFLVMVVGCSIGGISMASLLYGYLPVLSLLGIIVLLVCVYVSMMVGTVATLLCCRAFGYLIAEKAPHWVRR